MITLFELNNIFNINTLSELEEKCDAKVISKTGDHKYIFLKKNKPSNLNNDSKNRTKNSYYFKNSKKLYYVIVDMYELPTVISTDNSPADIWVVDSLDQAQQQLSLIINNGAKQFKKYIFVKD